MLKLPVGRVKGTVASCQSQRAWLLQEQYIHIRMMISLDNQILSGHWSTTYISVVMTSTTNPSTTLADALAQFSKAAYNAVSFKSNQLWKNFNINSSPKLRLVLQQKRAKPVKRHEKSELCAINFTGIYIRPL